MGKGALKGLFSRARNARTSALTGAFALAVLGALSLSLAAPAPAHAKLSKAEKQEQKEQKQDEQFRNSLRYKSFPVNLGNGEHITSLDAVVNNTVNADGVPEWQRLAGDHQIFQFTQKDAEDIKARKEELQSEGMKEAKAFREAFREQHPELIELIESSISFENRYERDDCLVSIFDAAFEGDAAFVNFYLNGEGKSPVPISVFMDPPELISPRAAAAENLGILPEELPEDPPGSAKLWQARVIIHELKHMAQQRAAELYVSEFAPIPSSHPHYLVELFRSMIQYKEIDSDYYSLYQLSLLASQNTVSPDSPDYIDPDFFDYIIALRRVAAVSDNTRFMGTMKRYENREIRSGSFPKRAVLDHHTSSVLEKLGLRPTIRDIREVAKEGLYGDRKTYVELVIKIRKALGITADNELEIPRPPIGLQAGVVQWLLDEGKLKAKEAKVAEDYLESVAVIGFEVEPYSPDMDMPAAWAPPEPEGPPIG